MDFVKIATAYVDEGGQLSVGEFCIELGLNALVDICCVLGGIANYLS